MLTSDQKRRRQLLQNWAPKGSSARILADIIIGPLHFLKEISRSYNPELRINRAETRLLTHPYFLARACNHGPRRHRNLRNYRSDIGPKHAPQVIDKRYGRLAVSSGRMKN